MNVWILIKNVTDAKKFIKKTEIAERVPLFAFNGYEFDLINVFDRKEKKEVAKK